MEAGGYSSECNQCGQESTVFPRCQYMDCCKLFLCVRCFLRHSCTCETDENDKLSCKGKDLKIEQDKEDTGSEIIKLGKLEEHSVVIANSPYIYAKYTTRKVGSNLQNKDIESEHEQKSVLRLTCIEEHHNNKSGHLKNTGRRFHRNSFLHTAENSKNQMDKPTSEAIKAYDRKLELASQVHIKRTYDKFGRFGSAEETHIPRRNAINDLLSLEVLLLKSQQSFSLLNSLEWHENSRPLIRRFFKAPIWNIKKVGNDMWCVSSSHLVVISATEGEHKLTVRFRMLKRVRVVFPGKHPAHLLVLDTNAGLFCYNLIDGCEEEIYSGSFSDMTLSNDGKLYLLDYKEGKVIVLENSQSIYGEQHKWTLCETIELQNFQKGSGYDRIFIVDVAGMKTIYRSSQFGYALYLYGMKGQFLLPLVQYPKSKENQPVYKVALCDVDSEGTALLAHVQDSYLETCSRSGLNRKLIPLPKKEMTSPNDVVINEEENNSMWIAYDCFTLSPKLGKFYYDSNRFTSQPDSHNYRKLFK